MHRNSATFDAKVAEFFIANKRVVIATIIRFQNSAGMIY